MNYILEYFDKVKQENIILPLEADTDKKAIKKASGMLKDKKYDRPGLYDAIEYERGE